MFETFDIGPLSWVKDEIDLSLKKVLDSFIIVTEKPEKFASLRFTTAHLYQVSGALDMVGLEGCKRYCSEIEKITSKLEKQDLPVSNALMEDLMHAVEVLSQYLQDLLNGMPDQPTRLYESLNHLMEMQGESLEVSALFYPDTSVSAPKDLAVNPIADFAIPIFVGDQRVAFQKSFLDWLRTKDALALNKMREAISNVLQVQKKDLQKTLWWVVIAFIEALNQSKISEQPSAKKLCRKLDQQLRNMSLGDEKFPPQLLNEVLYFVAISERATHTIEQVKDLFKLEAALPTQNNNHGYVDVFSATERVAVAQISADMPLLKDLCARINLNINQNEPQGDLEAFILKLEVLNHVLLSLNNRNVIKLFNLILAAAKVLQADSSKISEINLLELAASLNLLEFIAQHYQQLGIDEEEKISRQAQQLQALVEGVDLGHSMDALSSTKLDSNLVEAVAKQMIGALEIVEKALDAFFRDPEDSLVLLDAVKPLDQIKAALDMLEMPLPKSIVQFASMYLEHFQKVIDSHHQPNHALFELLAESLTRLRIYTEELPHIRVDSDVHLKETVQRLEQGLRSLDPIAAIEESQPSQDNEISQQATVAPITDSAIPIGEQSSGEIDNNYPVYNGLDEVTDQAIDAELQDVFLTEAEEVLGTIAQNIQGLRINQTNTEGFSNLIRSYHTLKGSGRTVGLVGMSKVAWSVEKLLNLVLERKAFPTTKQLDFVEKVSAAFARCIAHLQADKKVTLNPTSFQREAAELELEFAIELPEALQNQPKEEVLIGGTRKLSLAFFNIFLLEAHQHLETLIDAHQTLTLDSKELPSDASCRAAHTLGSNALAAGFKPIGDLARALEYWLDEHAGVWTKQHLALYGVVINTLASGLEQAKTYKNPKSTRTIVAALSESTAAMQAIASRLAEAAVLELEHGLEHDMPIAAMLVKKSKERTNVNLSFSDPSSEILAHQVVESLADDVFLDSSGALEQDNNQRFKIDQFNQQREIAVDQELLGLFVEEARELMPKIGSDIRGWRANPNQRPYPEALQRSLHTLKGSARMAGQALIGDSVHGLEDLVIRALKHEVGPNDFDEIFTEFDRIGYLLEDITDITKLAIPEKNLASTTRSEDRKSQFLRMRTEVLDRLINEAGEVSIMRSRMDREMQNFKQSSTDLTDSISRMRAYLRELEIEAETQMQSRMSSLQEANEKFDPLEFDRFTRLQELTRMMAESVNDLATIQHGLLLNLDQTDAALQQQNRMNRQLQKGLMGVRMLPFATISERLQRIVRQTARELNKRVELTIEGDAIELDRGVLDKLGAPIEHLLRNAVAHGLESSVDRKRLGKPEIGQIKLKVNLENDEIILVVIDDGAGIDLDKVKQKSIDMGIFSDDQEVSDQALMSVIFEPGFSTADTLTQISGRGVGLDAVRSDIAALSGRIDVSNLVGMGAKFNIYLPVTLSVAQVVMVRIGHKIFSIPSVMVEQVQKLRQNDLMHAYENQKIDWSDRDYPLYFLAKLIGDTNHIAEHHTYTPVILLRSGTYRTALHVDEIQGNQEVVMKQMGSQLAQVPGMIGATVLGDGSIVLVINPVQLANRDALSIGAIKVASYSPVLANERKVALIVDDSLTMRKVLSRVLERENFEVITANDGIDAIQKLHIVTPDIILSDIEMPRMDGFEFARHIRDNEKTANTPIIIISSRTAEKHRNFAKQIGVNAFLGKPVHDDVLLEQVNALLLKN